MLTALADGLDPSADACDASITKNRLEVVRERAGRFIHHVQWLHLMTGGSPDHAIIGNNIGRILGNLLQGRRCIVYNSDLYVELSDNYRVCPDATVSCDPRDRGSRDVIRYPCLVVEVLSATTEARDRGKKALQYRSCPTIQEYLLINSDAPIIEGIPPRKKGFWALYTLGQDDTVELPNLAIHFFVAEVYQNTSFE